MYIYTQTYMCTDIKTVRKDANAQQPRVADFVGCLGGVLGHIPLPH